MIWKQSAFYKYCFFLRTTAFLLSKAIIVDRAPDFQNTKSKNKNNILIIHKNI